MAKLRERYEAWCREIGEEPASPKRLGQELRDRFGVGDAQSNGRKFYTRHHHPTWSSPASTTTGAPSRPTPTPLPLSPLGEALAVVEGRRTYTLRRAGGGWELDGRDHHEITWAPAGSRTPRRRTPAPLRHRPTIRATHAPQLVPRDQAPGARRRQAALLRGPPSWRSTSPTCTTAGARRHQAGPAFTSLVAWLVIVLLICHRGRRPRLGRPAGLAIGAHPLTCLHCGSATNGVVLCTRCRTTLDVALEALPDYHAGLFSIGNTPAPIRGRRRGEPVDPTGNAIGRRPTPTPRSKPRPPRPGPCSTTWSRLLLDDRPQLVARRHRPAMAKFLRANLSSIVDPRLGR
jgi:hypothetical protein